MSGFLTKQIKLNFYSGAIKSAIVWVICLLIFFGYVFISPSKTNSFTVGILLITIIIGILSYLILIYSLINILNIRLKKIRFFRYIVIALSTGFLIFVIPILVLLGMGGLISLINNPPTSYQTSKPQSLDENKLWSLINEWGKQQGYQPYVKNTYLYDTAGKFLDFALYWSDNYLSDSLKPYFTISSYAWNYSVNRSPEESILNYWISTPSTKKNLTDYYYYSCLRCKDNNCLQLFYNEPSKKINNNITNNSNEKWGEVKQIDEHTFTQKLGEDTRMGTPSELLIALNDFRGKYNKGPLIWDDNLSGWAQSRAQTYVNIGNVDGHAGFNAEVESKYHEFGERFTGLGENGGFGPRLEAVHSIGWVFASDQPHRENMLKDWSHVGIAIASNDGFNYGVDLIFGKSR